MNLQETIEDFGQRARTASRELASCNTEAKNRALEAMADAVRDRAATILEANAKDITAAEANALTGAMIDRLRLDAKRLAGIERDIRSVAALPDPVGAIISQWERPNGLQISKVRVPIGVIGIIYESRPNVTSDAAILCTKTGNATILRGGSESIHSNIAIADALRHGLRFAGLPEDSILLVSTTDREAVRIMVQMDRCIDMIVPRGGQALIEAVVAHARMPVIKHYQGVCHVYVDREADLGMAQEIVINAKCQRPGVCNALETLLVHRDVAEPFLQKCGAELLRRNVELRGDRQVRKIVGDAVKPASEADWTTEYLDLILSARVVESADAAIDHIEKYGSHHSDAIVTGNSATADQFLNRVDSATVYWNASTRFTDGGEFGFGAEIGISTDKLHARGPMALEELTTYKYLIRGTGQIRT
ncbi:MAG TPA: glutamate-5-semialdehyde dehydrogenase [Chthoniobacterales bacterium]|nr:glutamate-5-semialdehyde dehydrogenase [Chthoniobacterales bacterium]